MDDTTRLQVSVAAAFLLLWGVVMVADLAASGEGGPMSTGRLLAHFGLLAIGFKGNLVAGIRFHINATIWGSRPLPRPWRLAVTGLLSLAALLIAASGFGALPVALDPLIAWVWLLATALLFAGVAWQRWIAPPHLAPPRGYAYDLVSDVLVVLAAGYAFASGIAAVWHAWDAPHVVHLWTVGYLVTMVTAILIQLLPRFATAAPPRPLGYLIALLAIPGPALVAYGQYNVRPDLLTLGAIMEGTVWLLLLLLIGFTYVKRRNPQPFAPAIGAALVFALAGAAVGATMARGDLSYVRLPLHTMLMLLGFLGSMVIGMGQVMLGLGHVRMGKQIVRMQGRMVLAWVGLFAVWALVHWYATPLPWWDLIPALLAVTVGVMVMDRMRRLLPVPTAPPRPLAVSPKVPKP